MRVLSLIGIVLLCMTGGVCARGAEPELSGVMRTDYFVVHYDPSDRYLAQITANIAARELQRVSRDLGYEVERDRPFPLYAYPTHYAFIESGGLKHRKFTVGTARPGDQRISVDASGSFVTTQEVLAHEITHVVAFRLLGRHAGAVPLWVHEGLAKYESQEITGPDDVLIANAARNGTLVRLPNLATDFPEDRVALSYAESASAIRYMVRQHGKSAPRKLIREVAETGSFEKAMLSVTGSTPDEFGDAWFAKMTKKHRGVRISGVIAGSVSALMAVLVVAAYLARRRQKMRAAREWDQEEFEEALRYQAGNGWWR